jgi:hypothetical protein
MKIAILVLVWFAVSCALFWANFRWRTWQESMRKLDHKPLDECDAEQAHVEPDTDPDAAREQRRAVWRDR